MDHDHHNFGIKFSPAIGRPNNVGEQKNQEIEPEDEVYEGGRPVCLDTGRLVYR